MKFDLATCEEKRDGTADDHILANYLQTLGHEVRFKVWSDLSLDWSLADLVIIRSTWDYQKHLEDFLAWARKVEATTRLSNPLHIIEWNASKLYLRDLQAQGHIIVPTEFSSDPQESIGLAQNLFIQHRELILKPAISASADLTFRIKSGDEIPSAVEQILKRGDLLVQPYLSSIEEEGEVSLVFFKRQYSHAILKKPKLGDFRVQSEFGGSVESFIASKELIEIGEKSLASINGDLLYARVDLVDWKTQPKIGELELIEPELFFRCDSRAVTFWDNL